MRVYFRFRRRDINGAGVLRPEALRRFAAVGWDLPPGVGLLVDLGPVRQLQDQLIRDVSLYNCAGSVEFTGEDGRAVLAHARALHHVLNSAAS